jgi:hypothetical protein
MNTNVDSHADGAGASSVRDISNSRNHTEVCIHCSFALGNDRLCAAAGIVWPCRSSTACAECIALDTAEPGHSDEFQLVSDVEALEGGFRFMAIGRADVASDILVAVVDRQVENQLRLGRRLAFSDFDFTEVDISNAALMIELAGELVRFGAPVHIDDSLRRGLRSCLQLIVSAGPTGARGQYGMGRRLSDETLLLSIAALRTGTYNRFLDGREAQYALSVAQDWERRRFELNPIADQETADVSPTLGAYVLGLVNRFIYLDGAPPSVFSASERVRPNGTPIPRVVSHWRDDFPLSSVASGSAVTIEADEEFTLLVGVDGRRDVEDIESELLGLGRYGVTLEAAPIFRSFEFTRRWSDGSSEDEHRIRVDPKPAPKHSCSVLEFPVVKDSSLSSGCEHQGDPFDAAQPHAD